MTTLVTGAAGFVGAQVVEKVLARGESLRVLLRDPIKAEALRTRGVETLLGDVRDPAVVRVAVRGVDVIHHCAAAVGPHFSAREICDTNLGGVRNVLEAMRQSPGSRLVLLSSINVLGTRNLDPATEALPYRRSSDPTADVKIEAEQLALDYHRRHAIDVTIFRPGFIYGAGDPHNVPRLARALRRGTFAYIGSRDNVAPIVHVADVADAMLLATRAASGRVYHVADGSRTTISQLVGMLAELLGCLPPRRVLPYSVAYGGCVAFELLGKLRLWRRPAPVTRAALRFLGTSRFIDIRRARDELGYTPRIALREGLSETVRGLQEQPHGKPPAVLSPA